MAGRSASIIPRVRRRRAGLEDRVRILGVALGAAIELVDDVGIGDHGKAEAVRGGMKANGGGGGDGAETAEEGSSAGHSGRKRG
jgi:hypothetical protein